MRVTFVTGVSCAGKSSVGEILVDRFGSELSVTDIDDSDRPHVGHLDWLHWRAAELLHEATELVGDSQKVGHYVVTGIVWPHALIDSNAWPAAMKAGLEIEFVMLDVPHKVIRRRLRDRGAKGKALAQYNRRLAQILRYQVQEQRHGYVLESEHLTPDEVADYVQGRRP